MVNTPPPASIAGAASCSILTAKTISKTWDYVNKILHKLQLIEEQLTTNKTQLSLGKTSVNAGESHPLVSRPSAIITAASESHTVNAASVCSRRVLLSNRIALSIAKRPVNFARWESRNSILQSL
ncbi:UNVERIFIED_CONTAM: hypothetical protein K2H54_011718, partial [Gekko kuhli]